MHHDSVSRGNDDDAVSADSAALPTNNGLPNLESLRLSQSFQEMAQVKAVVTTVPVQKPNKHSFVRVRSGEEWRLDTGTFTDRETGDRRRRCLQSDSR